MRAATIKRDDGTTIAYDVGGDAGPVVVFVHGLTSSRHAWEPVTRLLARDFTCVRIDLRGHGASSSAAEYSMPSLVGDVRAVVEDIGAGTPALVGHSLGASVVAIYAATHDARVVVCVDQSLRFGDFAQIVRRHASALHGKRTMEAVLAIECELKLEPYAELDQLERRVLSFPPEVVLSLWESLLTTAPEQLNAVAETVLSRITAPLLSLHGSPPAPGYANWLTGLVPSAQLEVWNGTGHMLHLVGPERFAARLRPLLANPEPSNARPDR